MTDTTATDAEPAQWPIDDELVGLREWASNSSHDLDPASDRAVIGTAAACAIRIFELAKPRRVSREHAVLERAGTRWSITDKSKNGLFLDGAQRERCVLVPGTEIGLGHGVTLIAESPRLIALRAVLARMLGWRPERAEAVDLALRAVRLAATRRSVLVLQGQGNLVPVAEELHAALLPRRPFVVCNPTLVEQAAGPYAPRRVREGLPALREAAGGTVCLLHGTYPRDFVSMLFEARRPECLAQLVVCTEQPVELEAFAAAPIALPAVRTRRAELDRLIDEYAAIAAASLAARPRELSRPERAWIRAKMSDTLADIQIATLRLTALQHGGSMAAGGELLGISERGLRKWFQERDFQQYLP